MKSAFKIIRNSLFLPVDAASIAVFRIGFGLIMLIDSLYHLIFFNLHAMFVAPMIFFRFYGFEWVPILREKIYIVYIVTAIASVGILLGRYYRTSVALVGVCTAWVFLQDQNLYLNHVYMLILYCILLFFIPANRYWALDAKISPKIANNTLPGWCRFLLVIQLEVILIWAGIVKLNPDWLQLEPLSHWLAYRSGMEFFGPLFAMPGAVALAAYGIIALHLIGAPLLLFKSTRIYILGFYGGFHLINHFVFSIGVFPWVTFFASLICFEPDWPRRLWARLHRKNLVSPVLASDSFPSAKRQAIVILLISFWLTYQIGMPMRNWFYEGWVAWNEQGHRFSWRMKLRSKQGKAQYLVFDPATNQKYLVPADRYLSGKQKRKMHCQPDMLLQMAHYLRDRFAPNGKTIENVQVYVSAPCSLNYRERQFLVDPHIDLAKIDRTLTGNTWITKLNKPLKPDAWWSLINISGLNGS